ncbi:Hypothetical predicted protein [Mytilus galloprovincialis]|uniref:Apple domain-containing protein n=1 Tax=Mytilus galloprovincialis TaxID=29158 RepID=A0A8B6DTY7_MYTGA|nr:Hypothetical predicted protein [Mytilus galloprovincialis]
METPRRTLRTLTQAPTLSQSNYCFCRETKPLVSNKEDDHQCTKKCQGNNDDMCGGYVNYPLITVSEIDRTTKTVNEKNTQGTSATYVSTRVSVITEFINMITSDKSSIIATKNTHYTTQASSSTTSKNANNDISSVMTETSTQATPDRKTETATESKATSAIFVSTRDSAITDFMNMITNDTSSALATEIAPYVTQNLSSTTSENAKIDITIDTTEASTQATTGLSTETESVKNTEATTVSMSIRESTATDVMRMKTRDTSPLTVTQSTHGIIQEVFSTTTENIDTAISTVMTETSSQTATAEQLKIIDVDVIMPACTCTKWNNLDEGNIFHCNYQATASANITIACQPNTRWRFVRIKRKDVESFTIREVDINGNPVNNTNESGLSSTAHACGHSGYGYAGPIIGTYVASSNIDCTIICFTITSCAAAEFDTKRNVCTLNGKCTNESQ